MDNDPSTRLLSSDSTNLPPQPPRKELLDNIPLFHDSSQSPLSRLLQLLFVMSVGVMVVISVILSIYRAAVVGKQGGSGAIYFLLGFSLIGFVAVLLIMVQFVKSGDLPREKTWFLYFVGGCTILEAIFIDILLFQ